MEYRSTYDNGLGKLLKCGDKRDKVLWVTYLKIHQLTNSDKEWQDVDCGDGRCVEIGLGSFVVADCIISGAESLYCSVTVSIDQYCPSLSFLIYGN